MSEVQPLQIFTEVHFYAQKRLKLAKLLKNIESKFEDVVKQVAGLGTPAQNFAGPPRVVRLKHHVSLSKLLSLTFVFTNYPLRTELIRLKTTLNPTKKSSMKGGLFCWLETTCSFRAYI